MARIASRDTPPRLQGARVLIVEDDVLLLMDLEAILMDAGAEVVGLCRTVADGLAAAQRETIAAAVLDVRIGGDTIPRSPGTSLAAAPRLFFTPGRWKAIPPSPNGRTTPSSPSPRRRKRS